MKKILISATFFLFTIFSPLVTNAATVFSAPYIGTPIDFTYATTYGAQTYLFDASTTPTTAPISYIRIKRLSGIASCVLNTGWAGDVHLSITDQSGALLARADGVSISGQYCTYHLSSIIPAGTLLGSVSLSLQYSDRTFVLDGSPQNSGMLRSGSGTTMDGGFAFELCDEGGCDGQFTLPPGYVTPPSDQSPTLTLRGDSIIYVEKEALFTDPGAIAYDPEEGDISGTISVSGIVDTSYMGTSTLTYSVMDSLWKAATPITRTVIVYDAGNTLLCQSGSSRSRLTPTGNLNLWASSAIATCGGGLGWNAQEEAGYFRAYATTDYPAGSTKGYFHLYEGTSGISLDCASDAGDLVNDLGFSYNPTGTGPGNPVVIPVHGTQCVVPRVADGRSYWWKFECTEGMCAANLNWKAHIGFGAYGSDVWTQTWSGTYAPPVASTVCTPGADGCYSNVMFLPGIEASRLYSVADGAEHRLWEPIGDSDAAQLHLDSHGKPFLSSDVYTRDVIDEAYAPQMGPNIYKSFIASMDKLKDDQQIVDWAPVPYDWRLSLEDILSGGTRAGENISYLTPSNDPYVESELKRLAVSSRTGKVTIIAHSNGGLVAKALMAKLGDTDTAKYIDKVIFVDVPQVGTPEAIGALLHGEDQGLPFDNMPLLLSPQAARSFAQNSPMAYNLLPSASYFTYIDDPVVTFNPYQLTDWVLRYGTTIHSQERLHTFLVDAYQRVAADSIDTGSPTSANAALLTKAEQMHTLLDSWTPPAGVKVIQIAGWGIPTTVKGFTYASTTKNTFCTTLCEEGLTLTASTTIDGDGTVVTPSQLWMSTSAGNVENYWVDLNRYNYPANRVSKGHLLDLGHKDVLEVDGLLSFISDSITDGIKPLNDYTYLTREAPPYVGHRLRYELHSPLTLDAYDNDGHHTGVSTTTRALEEQIPGTYYMEYAGVKYLFTGTDIPIHIVMNGYATSTFTFKAEELQGDTPVTSTTFQDIPTTPTTKVTINSESDITTLSPMLIDKNGDGTVDATIAPKIGGTAFLDTIPPEATIGFSTSTKQIIIAGTDDTSTTTIATTSTMIQITDATGNSLTLHFSKNVTETNKAAIIIPSFSYSNGSTTYATTSLKYFWSTNTTGKHTLFISAIRTPGERLIALYMPLLNKTYVVRSTPADDDVDFSAKTALLLLRNRLKTLNGLIIPSIVTKQGTVLVKY